MLGRPVPPAVRAWYWYAAAAEVYAACGLAIFVPILLELGFLDDGITSCAGTAKDVSCRVRVGGGWVDTASFAMYTKSVGVFLQAIVIISIGTLANSPFWRKRVLVVLTFTGAACGLSFALLPAPPRSPAAPLAAAALSMASSICHATAGVCANAFLPALARADPAVRAARGEAWDGGDGGGGEAGGGDDAAWVEDGAPLRDSLDEGRRLLESAAALPGVAVSPADLAPVASDLADEPPSPAPPVPPDHAALLSATTARLSSTQTAIGFLTGLAVLALLVAPVGLAHGSTRALTLAVAAAAACWAAAAVPAALGLPGGPRAPPPPRWAAHAWAKVGRMVRPDEMRSLPNLFMYLLAWIFLSDGFHTTTSTAVLYASSTLRMGATKVAALGLVVQLCAVASAAAAPRVQARLACSNLAFLRATVALALAVPVYACLGLVLPVGGLRTEGEMYVATAWFGILFGPFNSYARAVYAELIPPGHESSFFSLFALTDKSASFIGPAVVGAIADATGNMRIGFLFLLFLLAAPLPVLARVRTARGSAEARAWAAARAGQ